jgi:hypothetical protein
MVVGALVGFRAGTIESPLAETFSIRRLPVNFWHTKYQNVKLGVFSALPANGLA